MILSKESRKHLARSIKLKMMDQSPRSTALRQGSQESPGIMAKHLGESPTDWNNNPGRFFSCCWHFRCQNAAENTQMDETHQNGQLEKSHCSINKIPRAPLGIYRILQILSIAFSLDLFLNLFSSLLFMFMDFSVVANSVAAIFLLFQDSGNPASINTVNNESKSLALHWLMAAAVPLGGRARLGRHLTAGWVTARPAAGQAGASQRHLATARATACRSGARAPVHSGFLIKSASEVIRKAGGGNQAYFPTR